MIKTTERQFKLFCRECEKYKTIFGLQDWEITYSHIIADRGSCPAEIAPTATEKTIRITLFKYWWQTKGKKKYGWSKNPPDKEIKLCAFHEMIHLFLWDLVWYVENRLGKRLRKLMAKEEHRIINKLVNILLDKNGNFKYGK